MNDQVTIDQQKMMEGRGYKFFRFGKRSMSFRTMKDIRALYQTGNLVTRNKVKGFAS